jgi:hypothetical protein
MVFEVGAYSMRHLELTSSIVCDQVIHREIRYTTIIDVSIGGHVLDLSDHDSITGNLILSLLVVQTGIDKQVRRWNSRLIIIAQLKSFLSP